MRLAPVVLLLLCLLLAVGSLLVPARCKGQASSRLLLQAPQTGDGFGNAVAFGPNVLTGCGALYVGAWTRALDEAHPKAGMVQVFELSDQKWRATAEITPRVRAKNQRFGASLAVDSDTLLVGAPGMFRVPAEELDGGANIGAVYVFERSEGAWQQTAVLFAGDDGRGDSFGYSLALDRDRLLVGAIARAVPERGAGAVYVFERVDGTWSQVDLLVADDASEGALFGHAVALSGNTALVGASRDGEATGMRRGAAYVFERMEAGTSAGAWQQVAKLVAPGPAVKGRFGHALDLEGGVAVIAERRRPPSGLVHVYTKQDGRWLHSTALGSPSPDASEFGWSVHLCEGEVLIGDQFDSGDATHAGAAFRFARDEVGAWELRETFRSLSPCPQGEFGLSVALSPERAAVGAWLEDSVAPKSGAAHVFEIPGGD